MSTDIVTAYGGCGCSGGAESASSVASSNRALIRGIVGRIARLLNKSDAVKLDADPVDLVKQLRAIVPDPRPKNKGGKGSQFSPSASGNSKICREMAQIVNDSFGATVINTAAGVSPSEICDQIAEEMTSLASGVQAQFAGVRKYTERILNNLKTLEKIHATVFARLEQEIKKADELEDGSAYARTAVLRDFHNAVHKEIERQNHLLSNMLGVVIKGSPADSEIEAQLKASGQLKGFVRAIRDTAPGQAKFGEKLGFLMSGTQATLATVAALEAAMSKLGVTRSELQRASSLAEAREILSKKIEAKLKSPNAVLAKLLKAQAAVLERLRMLHDVGAKNSLMTGGDEGGDDYSDIMEDISGGDEIEGGDQKLDKRIKSQQMLRKGLLRQFGIRKAALWSTVVREAGEFGKAISAGRVPLSDKLDGFNTALSLIETLSPNIYNALCGYYNDAAARQVRESFIGNLEYVLSTIAALQSESGYASLDSLRGMKTAITEIIKLIGEYSERYATGFEMIAPPKVKSASATGGNVDESDDLDNIPEEATGGFGSVPPAITDAAGAIGSTAACATLDVAKSLMKCGSDEMEGADEIEGGADEPLETAPALNKIADDLERTKELISYAFRTRRIRDNLATMSGELVHYAEDYTKITADAVANAVDNENRSLGAWEKSNTRAVVAASAVPAAGTYDLYDQLLASDKLVNAALTEPTQASATIIADACEMHRCEVAARMSMYRTAEAVDMYIQKFASVLASSPDDLRDVVADVSDSHVNAQWFTNNSGDAICRVFDACPSAYNNAYQALRCGLNEVSDGTKHYYEKVGVLANRAAAPPAGYTAHALDAAGAPSTIAVNGEPALPGNPFMGQSAAHYKAHVKLAEDALKITSLKNIIATFLNFADKFGGKVISQQIPMTIAEIYSNLNRYIAVSAFTCARTPLAAGAAAGTPLQTAKIRTVPYTPAGTTATYIASSEVRVASVIDGVNPYAAGASADAVARHIHGTYAMRGVVGGGVYRDDFTETDKLFTMSVKSIVAKIFVARGTHDIFNRPITAAGLGYYNDLRMIIGGDDVAGGAVTTPKIIPEALELYIRLPLLAEFYREIFEFPNEQAGAAIKSITMVPEMDGTFTGLIAFIFDRVKHVSDGNYSDTDVAALISEVNRIYERFSKGANPVMTAIDAFIAEVNARYGVISRKDQDAFIKARDERWMHGHTPVDPSGTSDYALPEIDEEEKYNRPMPSQMYELGRGPGDRADAVHKHKLEIDANGKMINGLRNRISKLFADSEGKLLTQPEGTGQAAGDEFEDSITAQREIGKRITLKHLLKARTEEMRYAKTEEDKFAVVLSAINSLGQYSLSALEKSYVAFHEFVIAPLNVLNASYREAREYTDRIAQLNAVVEGLSNPAIMMRGVAPITAVQFNAMMSNINTAAADAALLAAAGVRGLAGPAEKKAAAQLRALQAYWRIIEMVAPGQHFGPAGPPEWARQGGGAPVPTWAQIDGVAGLSADQKTDAVARFSLDYNRMLRHLLETVYVHAQTLDKFVALRVEVVTKPDSTCAVDINADHSALIEHVQGAFAQVKATYNKFRGLLPEEKIKCYEDVNKTGSIYWLEKNYLDVLIRGRGAGTESEANSLDRTNSRIGTILKHLTRNWSVRADPAATLVVMTQQHSYLRTLAEMVAGGFATVAIPAAGARGSTIFASYDNRTSKQMGGTAASAPWPGLPANAASSLIGSVLGPADGAVVQFNTLLAAFMGVAYDAPTQKFFGALLNEMANGALSASVMSTLNDNRIDDSVAGGVMATAVLAQPHVMMRSLAHALQHFIVDKAGDNKTPLYLDMDVANLQTYTKERMRSELPIFARMFQEMIHRCDFLKSMSRAFCMIDYATTAHTPAAYSTAREAKITAAATLLDKVLNGCLVLGNGAKEALKLIGDDPKYMELSQNFIGDYRAMNSCDPFMPLSSSTVMLRAGEQGFNQLGLPGAPFATDVQKIHYGLRRVLHSEARAADIAGVLEISRAHNQACDKRFHMEDADVLALANSTFELERFLLGTGVYRQWISVTHPGGVPVDMYRKATSANTAIVDGTDPIYAFALVPRNTLASVVRMTESNAQKDQRRAIVQIVERTTNCNLLGERKDMIVFNIIDINKVPINEHALMRDIPLVHLHLYADEFDKTVNSVLSTKAAVRPAIVMRDVPQGRDMLAEMLVNPHALIAADTYEFRWQQIVRGDLSIAGLAQPKMLGQELFSKALFGEIYPGQVYAEESDSGLGNANLRGRQAALKDGPMRDVRGPALLKYIFESLFVNAAGVWPNIASWHDHYSAFLHDGGVALFKDIIVDVATGPAASGLPAGRALHTDVPRYLRDLTAADLIALQVGTGTGAPQAANAVEKNWIQNVHKISQLVMTIMNGMGKYVRAKIVALSDPARNPGSDANVNAVMSTIIAELNTAFSAAIAPGTNINLPGVYIMYPAGLPATRATILFSANSMQDWMRTNQINFTQSWQEVPRAERQAVQSRNPRYFPEELMFMPLSNKYARMADGGPTAVNVGGHKDVLQVLGKLRFDTFFARNIIWLTNIQRLVLLKLSTDYTWSNSKIVSGPAILARGNTEFYGKDMIRDKGRSHAPGNYKY